MAAADDAAGGRGAAAGDDHPLGGDPVADEAGRPASV